jgi:hypothetical protein
VPKRTPIRIELLALSNLDGADLAVASWCRHCAQAWMEAALAFGDDRRTFTTEYKGER